MKYVKFIAILLISIFLFSSISSNITATAKTNEVAPIRPLDRILMRIFKYSYSKGPISSLLFSNFNTPWKVFRFADPDFFTAEPNTVDLENLNRAEIVIGIKDASTGGYRSLKTYQKAPFEQAKDFTFKLETPEGIPEGVFITKFSPPTLIVGEEGEVKTKLTIDLNIPDGTVLPDKILLRVNVTKYTTFGNLWTAFGIGAAVLALLSPNPWPTFSGKRLPDDPMYVDILIKTNRFHLADITPPQSLEMKPNELQSIPIDIKNLGSHTDTFNFRVSADTDYGMIVSPPPAITLKPNEIGHTSLSIATPRNFRDPGTVRSIDIEAYSIYEPEKVFKQTVTITTKGVYVSETNGIYSVAFLILIALGVAFVLFRRRKKLDKICKKPDKPWDIPEEKQHLEELKKKDKKGYNETLKMMKEEYESALLGYKETLKVIIQKEKQKKQKQAAKKEKKLFIFTNIFKKIENRQKTKKTEENKPIKIKEEKPEETKLETGVATEDIWKKETIERIKRDQDKQRKKFKSST